MIPAGTNIGFNFAVYDADGVQVQADALPTGVLRVNGTGSTALTIALVEDSNPPEYRATGTVPSGTAFGAVVEGRITATVDGIEQSSTEWRDSVGSLSDITGAVSAIRASVSSAPYKGGKLRKVIGDDLVQAAGTQVGWELVNAAGIVDLTTATVKLLITVGGVTTVGTGGAVTTPTGATRAGYVEINAADWPAGAVAGDGEYQWEFTVGGDKFTLIEGVAELVAKAGA